MSASKSKSTQQLVALGALAAVATASILYYVLSKRSSAEDSSFKKKKDLDDEVDNLEETPQKKSRALDFDKTPLVKNGTGGETPTADSTTTANNNTSSSKQLHAQIEELDKKGKAFFKDKQYMEAAQKFTEALDLIEKEPESAALARQTLTLLNNRSAMYEKASMPELALEDCDGVLSRDPQHTKARLRKLRLLEQLKRYNDALVQVCAFQLLFMQANRTNLRMGLPTPPPPVPTTKMEEVLGQILPDEVRKYAKKLADMKDKPLPSGYTIGQLLRSYSDYNAWMAQAAGDGTVTALTEQLSRSTLTSAEKVTLLVKRGRRNVYDKEYADAIADFEEAYGMVVDDETLRTELEDDLYARLLEWTGMIRHWQHKLDSANVLYEKCADLEPTKAILLVKQAGIQIDSGNQKDAMELFDVALGVDEQSVDALLHRANLFMLKAEPENARKDLEKCISIKANHVVARLRLASILAASNDIGGAESQLALAEQAEPRSSEVQSYKGEIFFMKGEMDDAVKQFKKAIELDSLNPTPYVNIAMAILNTPPPNGQMPDANEVMRYLEKGIEVDPSFVAAYIQLGQLKLGTATDLNAAREVVELYDKGLSNCRTPEEMKEVCSMRILAVAQVEAATLLKMETFQM